MPHIGKEREARVAILAQVRNSFKYIPAFIAYHLRVADTILLIDHNSSIDLRSIKQPRVDVCRIGSAIFAKDIYITYFIHELDIRQKYDFLFVLDIDEFLPFACRDDMQKFCDAQKHSSVVFFNWRNGYNTSSDNITGMSDTFIFTRWLSATRKLGYNLRRVRFFLPHEGNHAADYLTLDTTFIPIRPKEVRTNLGLFHIPFIGAHDLPQKLQISNKFEKRISRNMHDLQCNLNALKARGRLSDNDMMTLVANYRENWSSYKPVVTKDDFYAVDLFGGLDKDISEQRAVLRSCAELEVANLIEGEKEVIRKLRKNRFLHMRKLINSISRGEDGQYRLIL